jgi:hypothetical protein
LGTDAFRLMNAYASEYNFVPHRKGRAWAGPRLRADELAANFASPAKGGDSEGGRLGLWPNSGPSRLRPLSRSGSLAQRF